MADPWRITWSYPTTPELMRRDREWTELALHSLLALPYQLIPPYQLIGARPLHPSPWQPVDAHTPLNRWILLRGGTTDEAFYTPDAGPKDNARAVTARWIDGAWAIGYQDGMWRNTYLDPAEWMDIPA